MTFESILPPRIREFCTNQYELLLAKTAYVAGQADAMEKLVEEKRTELRKDMKERINHD